mmetsp:Transcript_14478/g.21600  ORF Transcript_14478/g.21600 Transcript_14478/m.21600 type:complete len:99 (+) Transcript_14478:182-478(+)
MQDEVIVSIPAGEICPGTLLGIMGPSGCGKITFLDVLSSSVNGLSVDGQVYIEETGVNKSFLNYLPLLRKQVGFVNQDDSLFSDISDSRECLQPLLQV